MTPFVMADERSTRRRFLRGAVVVGVPGATGCLRLSRGGEPTPQDADGDGVPDEEDYAPDDPNVQRKEQLQDGGSTATGGDGGGAWTVIDDFEGGALAADWEVGVSGNVTPAAPAETFEVQSDVSPQGTYALRGSAGTFSNGSSTVTRSDVTIDQDGTDVELYLRIGELLDDAEQANQVRFISPEAEDGTVVLFDQKTSRSDYTGRVVDDRLGQVQRVALNGIDFSANRVEEVRIGGQQVQTDLQFQTPASSITAVRVRQGHFRQPSDVLVDRIRFAPP